MNSRRRIHPFVNLLAIFVMLFSSFGSVQGAAHASPAPAEPAKTMLAAPASVTIAGDLNSEMGCAGDWDPACAAAHLTYDAADDVWQGSWALPAGNYEYKAALNDAWAVSYPGSNVPLALAAPATVKFYYDDKTNYVTENVNRIVAVAPGDFQSELG